MFISKTHAEQIVKELHVIVGHDINIMDKTGIIIASSNPKRIGTLHNIAKNIIDLSLLEYLVQSYDVTDGVQEGINLPIHLDGVCEGVIGITGQINEVISLGKIVKKMTEIMLAALQTQEQENLLERSQNLYIEEVLFSSAPDWAELHARGKLLNLDFVVPRRIALLEYADLSKTSQSELQILRISKQYLRRFPHTFYTIINHRLLILLDAAIFERIFSILKTIKREIETEFKTTASIGISSIAGQIEDMRRCYSEAKIAVNVASQKNEICEYNNKSVDFIVKNIDRKVKQDFLNAIIPSISCTERKEMFEFLQTYFRFNGNIEEISDYMSMHPNTVRYKISRISKLTGLDLRIPKDLTALYIALQFELF